MNQNLPTDSRRENWADIVATVASADKSERILMAQNPEGSFVAGAALSSVRSCTDSEYLSGRGDACCGLGRCVWAFGPRKARNSQGTPTKG
jgi:hypothetical protein